MTDLMAVWALTSDNELAESAPVTAIGRSRAPRRRDTPARAAWRWQRASTNNCRSTTQMARVLLLLRGCDEGWCALVQPAMGNDVSRQRVPMSVVEGAVVGPVPFGAPAGEAAADATGACVAFAVPIVWSSAPRRSPFISLLRGQRWSRRAHNACGVECCSRVCRWVA